MLPLLGVTLFVSAFLLFCCEPMVGKMVLPIMGGSASVWTTCVLFFQIMLLGGYVYTHLLGKLKRLQDQVLLHASLMLLALWFLPIHFNGLSGHPSDAPVTWLLEHLFISVGIPFAVISATAPLLQYWLAKTPAISGRDPYFLYGNQQCGQPSGTAGLSGVDRAALRRQRTKQIVVRRLWPVAGACRRICHRHLETVRKPQGL